MGTRFRKSKKLIPGVKLNVGKESVGLSIGGKFGGVSVNSKGDVTNRVSVPGTGLSYVERKGKSKRQSEKEEKAAKKEAKKRAKENVKYCGECGTKMAMEANFCPNCGTRSAI